jgi:hypothetical protein
MRWHLVARRGDLDRLTRSRRILRTDGRDGPPPHDVGDGEADAQAEEKGPDHEALQLF